MKKSLVTLLILTLSMPVWAVTYIVDNIRYDEVTAASGSTYGTVKCMGFDKALTANTALTIPYVITYNGNKYYVKSINESAFEGQTKLTSVRLSYGVQRIGFASFRNCSSITYAQLPSSMTDIAGQAFYGCTSLNHVYYARTSGKLTGYASPNAFPASTKCKLYVPWEANYDDFRAESIWNTDAFYSIAHSSYAWDIYMADGTMAVVTKPSTSTSEDHECTIIGFNKNGGGTGVAEGKYCPASYHTKPTSQDRYFKYTRVSKLAFTDNADLKQLDLSHVNTITEFGELMCDNASNLSYVNLVSGTVGTKAFNSCPSLRTAYLEGVTRIAQEAFAGCKALTFVYLGSEMKSIMHGAFRDCNIADNMCLPVGLTTLGNDVFAGTKIDYLLVPSTVTTLFTGTFRNMSSLKDLVLNVPLSSTFSLDMTGVPTTCVISTPVEHRANIRANASFNGYTVVAGAYDFCRDWEILTNLHKMTVTSTTPVTVDGVTYDGKAKYVFNKQVARGDDSFVANDYEIDRKSGKKYLMTEIGDSCLFGSTVEFVSLLGAKHIEKIGRRAFGNCKARTITLPESVNYFGTGAFNNAKYLKELVIRSTGSVRWEGQWIGNNAYDFTLYINSYNVNGYMTSNMKDWKFSDTRMVTQHIAPFIKPEYNTFHLGQSMPLDFEESGVKAYIVNGFYPATKTAYTREVKQVPANTGVIVTGLTPGYIYKIKRIQSASVPSVGNNYLVANPGASVDLSKIENAYRWDAKNEKFVRPTSTFNSGSGYCYFKPLSSTSSEYFLDILQPAPSFKKGDVDGNGDVDITDANILFNIILGKDSASTYGGRADVDGNGEIDITDANTLINIILGK